ncbi:hypothetical protein KIW84_044328 [Lathyrus oleraceus]|uniref:DUF7745 domain-containing protein n=1 Tax=Pisum sativum TaxID=3888 RepID=A0A9D5AVU7_PEA|nr:hypothetical protein KIW84_044328 [Pisum sativum]
MERQKRHTKKYNFRQPDLKELRNLTSYVLDSLGFKACFGKLLPLLTTQVDEGLMGTSVQFYDPLYRCFSFPDFQLLPTLEEYAYLVGIPILDQVPFSGLESIPTSQEIADLLHIDESLIHAHMTSKGGIQGLPSEFLIAQATAYGKAMSEDVFEAIFVLLIYGLVLFPNIDKFVDVNAIRIFSALNLVPTLLGDTYFSLHLRNAKGGGAIVCCLPLLYKWFISHLPQTLAFKENKGCLRWSTRLMSLTNDDISWYNRVYDGVQIIDSCGEFSNVPLLGTCGGISYNPILARRQLGFPLKDKPNNIMLEGVFFQEGKDPQGLKGRMVRAWCKIHKKGRNGLGPKNCIALEPYTAWVRKRASEYLMPYDYLRPTPLVVAGPSTLPNQGVIDDPGKGGMIDSPKRRQIWKQPMRERFCSGLLSCDLTLLLFIYFEDKLTHRYYTRANSSRLMDHLEQENRELKEEVARLSALMESFLAAQNQSSPTPSTPPQRTVVSEIVSSAVPAASAYFATAMPTGFPWGMPPSFMPDIPAPTFASMPASTPVLDVPPPVVHTVPRVDDTIYHSESSESPDVHEKMDVMNDQFLELRKELKNLRGKDLFGKSAAELCLVPGVKIPVKFKVPDFEKYKGNTFPLSHLVMYARKMSTQTDNDQLLIHYFQDSLSGAALRWSMSLDSANIRSFNDLGEAFVKKYKYNMDMAPDRDQLRAKIFLKTLSSFYYEWMIASAPSDFTEMVNMGMRLEEGVREGQLTKDEGSSTKRYGAFAKKKDGEAHAVTSHVKPRRPSVKRKPVRPASNQHQVAHIAPVFRDNQQYQQHNNQ